ncbi:unnamed protein product [Lactuca saligna]|uniref:Uncharacterized protein n=1 Tax=Lactuca saligna TaxID=75948 RepID=A0AA35Z5K5_LACSI|nr:unnamed protein product [Lactuca saligna]
MIESERVAREKRDKELGELNALWKKLYAEEVKVKNSKIILENQKSLLPAKSHERIQKEALDDPNLYWLEPTTSFDKNNDIECQLDMPMTPRAFLFRCFEKIEKYLISNKAVNQMLFSFYMKYVKPKYESWSLKKNYGTEGWLAGPDRRISKYTIQGVICPSFSSEDYA